MVSYFVVACSSSQQQQQQQQQQRKKYPACLVPYINAIGRLASPRGEGRGESSWRDNDAEAGLFVEVLGLGGC